MDNQKKNQLEEWYKINKCSNEANLFILCMKTPLNNKMNSDCKYLFHTWFKCINIL